ncbi:MAG: metal ABC transporter permease [Acidobacteriota bacterium]
MDLFEFWLWPLLAIVLLPGLLVYFGLHVVERGIIFVDLALAQIAALGVCVAIVIGEHSGGDPPTYLMSLLFTLFGAALFSWTRFRHTRVPQEAIIGIIYVVAAAAATVVLSRTGEGDEALKGLLLGNILLVSKVEVLGTFTLYAIIALIHYLLRGRFLMITFREEEARRLGVRLRLWDFVFYATFGLVVTSFVQIMGVYLVFSYLIVPAVCGAILSERVLTRLIIGWAVALVTGVAGLLMSVESETLDLPTGPTIVCLFGVTLLLCGGLAWKKTRDQAQPGAA